LRNDGPRRRDERPFHDGNAPAARGDRSPDRNADRRPPPREQRRDDVRPPVRSAPYADRAPRDDRGFGRAPRDERPARDDGDAGFVRNDNEQKVAGENACRALFMQRPDDIRRVYVTDEVLPRFKDVLRFCAERKLAYHVKTDADLDQIAETVHHDGVLFLARKAKEPNVDDVFAFVDDLGDDDRAVLVLLQDVKNPHNLGAILRVCAHFGVPYVLRAGETPALSPAAMRTAEGGAEHSRVVDVGDGVDVIESLQERGFGVLATSSHATVNLGHDRLPPRAVVLFGSEGEGLSKELMDLADGVIAIPGSGALESLNVACAASVVLWELWREATRPVPKRAAPQKPRAERPDRGERPQRSSSSSSAPSRGSRWD
jgi:TrmH RNA methyltransferase